MISGASSQPSPVSRHQPASVHCKLLYLPLDHQRTHKQKRQIAFLQVTLVDGAENAAVLALPAMASRLHKRQLAPLAQMHGLTHCC